MEQIIIDGVNLSDLKVKYDALAAEQAAMRASICKGASKYIADAISEARKYIEIVLEADTVEDVDSNSQAAYNLLKNASFVSDVSGVSYTLPYYDHQSEYAPDGEPYTNQFDQSENELLGYDHRIQSFQNLWGLLEDMESEVAEWNTSYC